MDGINLFSTVFFKVLFGAFLWVMFINTLSVLAVVSVQRLWLFILPFKIFPCHPYFSLTNTDHIMPRVSS